MEKIPFPVVSQTKLPTIKPINIPILLPINNSLSIITQRFIIFSSLIAKRTMIEGNFKKSDRQKKENVDVIAATIILQDYIRSLEIKDHQKHK